MSSRVARLVAAARAARSWELTKLGTQDALRIVTADGTQMSVLTPDELAELRDAIVAGPEVWTIAGLPACTFDGTRGAATGTDDVHGVRITLVGTRDQLTSERARFAARSYAEVLARRDELAGEIAGRLGKLYNDTWRQGRRLGREELAARVTLAAFVLYLADNGQPTLYFDDGELFGGHEIEVALAPDGTVASCGI